MGDSFHIDLHVHSREGSADAHEGAGPIVEAAVGAGLHGMCVVGQIVPDAWRADPATSSLTPEQSVAHLRRGYDAARQAVDSLGVDLRVYFGLEYRIPKTVDDVLVLGLPPEALTGVDVLRASPWDLRRFVTERGGVLCAAHPFRHRSHGAPFGGPNLIDAVEVVNGRRQYHNRDDLAARWCEKIGGLALAGSDAHAAAEVGEAATLLSERPEGSHELGAALRGGRVVDLAQRRQLWPGLQSCRFNGLYIEDELRHTARQGLAVFEIFFDQFMPADIDARARQRIADMAQGMGLALTVQAPVVPLCGASGLALLHELIAFAEEIGATLLTLPALCVPQPGELAATIEAVVRRGTRVAVGNGPDVDGVCGPNRLVGVAKALPGTLVALDIGYAHLTGDALGYTRELVALLDAHGLSLVHLQLHDNDGQRDLHLSLGAGTLPLPEVLEVVFAAGFDGIGVIEHWRDLSAEVEQLRHIVQRIPRPRVAVDLAQLAAGARPATRTGV